FEEAANTGIYHCVVVAGSVRCEKETGARVDPAVTQSAGAMELAFPLPDEASVDTRLAEWRAPRPTPLPPPNQMVVRFTRPAPHPVGPRPLS
ncbi:hypothetical protein ACQ4LF_24020, partial [Aeromonas salmonicida]